MALIEDLFDKWVKAEGVKLSRKKVNRKEEAGAKRTYLHFDLRRPKSSLFSLKNEFLNQDKVARHGYWPFLKMTIDTPRIKNVKEDAVGKFKNRDRRKEIKKREVYYASHYDALIYSWYSFLLNSFYEDKLKLLGINDCVTAYRKIPVTNGDKKNKSSIDFAFEVFGFIRQKEECVAIVSDITKFFDSLDHEILKKEWCQVIGQTDSQKLPNDHYSVYNNLTKFKFVDAKNVFKKAGIKFKKIVDKTDKHDIKIFKAPFKNGKKIEKICEDKKEFLSLIVDNGFIQGNHNKNNLKDSKRMGQTCGIMQGAPISATLANIYMLEFDKEISDYVNKIGGIYRRYSDDLVVICGIDKYKEAIEFVCESIKKYELKINPNKTDITLFIKNNSGLIRGFKEIYLKSVDKKTENLFYKSMQYLGFEYDGQNAFLRSSSLSKYYRKMKSKIGKSVNMAYGKRSKSKDDRKIFTKLLIKKYIYRGRRSFISYAYRSIDISLKILGSDSIRKQLSKRYNIMLEEIDKKVGLKIGKYR
ncbi:MAG: reverse transcriptase domain-containing protein [Patescibacteria group bacterium]|nr:reverse transcriptase domain-containing protein [Patescibacteria group bacterium]